MIDVQCPVMFGGTARNSSSGFKDDLPGVLLGGLDCSPSLNSTTERINFQGSSFIHRFGPWAGW